METDDTVNANDALITLIRVAEENTDIRLTLLGILNQPSFHRKSLLNNTDPGNDIEGGAEEFNFRYERAVER